MGSNTEERQFKIRRNLTDAGCSEALIARFLQLDWQQKRREQYRLLSRHKASLLEQLHHDQYKIDCLDHMVYAMCQEDQQ